MSRVATRRASRRSNWPVRLVLTVQTRAASNIAEALIQFAGETAATQIVLGESNHSRLYQLLHGSVLREVLKRTRNVDVFIARPA